MQRRLSNPPQPQYVKKMKFEKKIPCQLNMSMNGIKIEESSQEQKKQFELSECIHRIWPPIMPQCIECLKSNKHEQYMVSKNGKGLAYKIIG